MQLRRAGCLLVLLMLAGCRQVAVDTFPSGSLPAPTTVPMRAELAAPIMEMPAVQAARADAGVKPVRPVLKLAAAQVEKEETEDKGEKKDKEPKSLLERLQYPKGLPGGNAPEIKLPPAGSDKKEIEAAIRKYFPPLPPLGSLPTAEAGPLGHPLALEDLQNLALGNSPLIKQAAADVEAARGARIQAGLYPNPTIGYEGDNMNQGHTSGTQGGFVDQVIKTANKLGLARAAGERDIELALIKKRQIESEVIAQVRSQYFSLIAARKNFEITRSLAELTDEVYRVLVLQLQVGEVATYEPMQLRVMTMQARGTAIQAQNRYVSAWNQLASAMGLPEMPLTEIAGTVDMAIPQFEYDAVLAHVLTRHTDVQSAETGVEKARLLLRLAQVQPMPDVDVRVVLQNDTTNTPHAFSAGVQVGIPFPLWDKNQGNIRQAFANLRKANEDNFRARASLTAKVAEAFERYDNNRKLLELYRAQMLPSQVQAFRGAVARHARAGEKGGVSYNDLVSAEQATVTLLGSYVGALKDQWDAVVDMGALLQIEDLFGSYNSVSPPNCTPQ